MIPDDLDAICPRCGHELWARRGGQWTLRSAMLKFAGGNLIARCPESRCSGEVLIPWLRVEGVEPTRRRRRYVVRRDLTAAPETGEGSPVDGDVREQD